MSAIDEVIKAFQWEREQRISLEARLAEAEAHLESLQNRYAQVTAENLALSERCKEHEQFRHQHRDCDAMGVENQSLRLRLTEAEAHLASLQNRYEQVTAENVALRTRCEFLLGMLDLLEGRLVEAEALLRVMPGYGLSAYDKERWEKARNAFLAPDSSRGDDE